MDFIRLFSYKMTNDSGFAPNPFHGFLTLANCKPCIRKSKKVGDWIAGFTSKQLNGDKPGEERLLYLMQVNEKVTYSTYWNNDKYLNKKPNLSSQNVIDKAGDNIYRPISSNSKFSIDFEQIPNKNHGEKNKTKDLSGEYVLISENFYYFGSKAFSISEELRPNLPTGVSAHGALTHDQDKANRFIKHIQDHFPKGIVNVPHLWPEENLKKKQTL